MRPGEATVILPVGYNFMVGDELTFLAEDLSVAGKGNIKTISPNKTRAIVKVKSGKVEKGMVIETAGTRAQSAPTTSVNVTPTKYTDLSEADRRALQIGEISDASYIIGGILATYPLGLGIGHAVQGRYADTGYIFTIGELGSLAVLVAGIGDCSDDWWDEDDDEDCNGGLIFLGAAGYLGFRIWEAIDAWAVPPGHNRRVREIKARTGIASGEWKGFVIPVQEGALAGISYRF